MNRPWARWTGRALVWAALAAAPQPARAAASRGLLDRIVAVVDDHAVLLSEVQARAAAGGSEAEALDQEIDERLMEQAVAQQRGALGVGERDVDQAIDEVCATNHLDRDSLEAALRQQGLEFSEYRAKLRTQLERARLVQARVHSQPPASEAELRRHCLARHGAPADAEVVCASHILVAVAADADPSARRAARARAERLRGALVAGADFARLAGKESDDSGSPDGALGCFHRGEMLEAFERAAFALDPGQLSEVIQTEVGLHIVRVDERRADSEHPCDGKEAQDVARQELFEQQMQRQLEQLLAELRRAAAIERRPPPRASSPG